MLFHSASDSKALFASKALASGSGAWLPHFAKCNASEALLFLEFGASSLQTNSLISPQHVHMVLKARPISTLLTTIFTVNSDTALLHVMPMLTYVMPMLTYMMRLCACRC